VAAVGLAGGGCAQFESLAVYRPPPAPTPARLDTIAFGSCLKGQRAVPVVADILAADPDLMLMIGDNVYVDLPDIPRDQWDYRAKYDELAENPDWQRLRDAVPILATWDDHDYGRNNAGKEWWLQDEAKAEYLRFFEVPYDAPLRQRDGIYQSSIVGPPGNRVQIILLDLRTFKDKFALKVGGVLRGGPYKESRDTQRTLLGTEQWNWLERQLRKPAEVRLIVSSIQVVAEEHGHESWDKLPHERRRLFQLLRKTGAAGVVFLTGDRHHGEISVDDDSPIAPYPVWDVTSSGLNQGSKDKDEPNRHRLGDMHHTTNFGLVHIDWSRSDPLITLQLRGLDGTAFSSQQVRLSALHPGTERDQLTEAGP
jgi:alkaline phosphatase D